MVNPIPLLMILHLHRFPYFHRGNLDENKVNRLDDDEESGAGVGG